jgi:adenylate cyclase class 2
MSRPAASTLIGRPSRSYQETRRISFVLDGAQLEIGFWPRIPPYLEIEAGSRDEVVRVAGRLGHRESEVTGKNTTAVYARYGIDLTTIADLRF